ncbi:MAG: homocysteine S-methyltransferase family protein [Myxococcales bacterium]|nr:homocysteine S-methyltransferase family protein [Myxococcales bacterium]
MSVVILDGPMGTELLARGVETPLPLWSAAALQSAPERVHQVHAAYARAGASVHTSNTFRTRRRLLGEAWEPLARLAVRIAREAVPAGHRIAGSIAPLEDCYRPELSPPDGRAEHRELARCLAEEGVDLLLCETFPHIPEALVAVEEAVATGCPTWLSLTAGPAADLLTPEAIREGARQAIERGAQAVLINCIPASRTLPFVRALAGLGIPFGAYANAGAIDERIGWSASSAEGASRYLEYAESWVAAGATLIGGCCGTSPAHIRALSERFR